MRLVFPESEWPMSATTSPGSTRPETVRQEFANAELKHALLEVQVERDRLKKSSEQLQT